MSDKEQKTSDLNFVAFLATIGIDYNREECSFQNGRVRVWFYYEMTPEEFRDKKDIYFRRDEKSKVPAHTLFEERDRIYAIMSHKRQEMEKNK